MKHKFLNILLCLLLVLSLCPAVMAASLDTTALTIEGNTVTIEDSQGVLAALHAQNKTAKLAVPYSYEEQLYVLKDNAQIVEHTFFRTDDGESYIQFETPDAGEYVILSGVPETLQSQLAAGDTEVTILSDETLETDHTVAPGTTIYANGNRIQGSGGSKKLTAAGALTISGLNGTEALVVGAGSQVVFDTQGNVTVYPVIDAAVGHGSILLTAKINGKDVTQKYFLVAGEKLILGTDGSISGNLVFSTPSKADSAVPEYRISYDAHDNTHQKDTSGKVAARCNGLFEYYTVITIAREGSDAEQVLVKKENGKDVVWVSGIAVTEGSTVLTMDSTYLNTLPVGKHTLKFFYADGGVAVADLHITAKESVPDKTNPKTGDSVRAMAAVMLVSAAMLALTTDVPGRKRR